MDNNKQFDRESLRPIKPELDAMLDKATQVLEQYYAGGASDGGMLHEAIAELQQVRDSLQQLGLDGLVVYCRELGKLLQELADGILQASTLQREAIDHALLELRHYLDALAQGATNAVLRLFNQYQEVLQARGIEAGFEVDLFFPELAVELPAAVNDVPLAADAAAALRSARSQYQQALLQWLRNEDAARALQSMRTAVAAALACTEPERRAFWWVAGGLLDCLIYEGLPPELSARKMLGRIDLQMKAQAEGNAGESKTTLSEMLYLLACSHVVSEAVDAIRRAYALDDYLPQQPALPPAEAGQLLEQMRGLLQEAESNWTKCMRDGHAGCREFADQAGQLYAWSEQLERNTLQFPARQILRAAAHLDDRECVQRMAMDMVQALLLLSAGVEHYGRLGSDFHERARIIALRLQQAVMNEAQDESELERLQRLQRTAQQRDARLPLAAEMLRNLQLVAQGLHAFFGNPGQRGELSQLLRLLHQVGGGLHMLSLARAGQLLQALQRALAHYAEGANPESSEQQAVVAAIDALQACTQRLAEGAEADETQLEAVLQGMQDLQHPDAVVSAQAASRAVAPDDESGELLEVFIEEAQGVLDSLRATLETGRHHPENTKLLAAIRHGFHTLKGSGRMVGLGELGETAWAIERALNRWLQRQGALTPVLLDFLGRAADRFQGWVDTLSSEGAAVIDGGELQAEARQLERAPSVPQAAVTPPAEQQEAVASEAETSEAGIGIGDITLSPTLFEVATTEAAGQLAELREHLAALRASEPPAIPYDFMRAAHTLASVNRTTGFIPVAELARALELWLEQRIDRQFTLNSDQLGLLEETLDALDTMCSSIREAHESPQPQPELIARLQAERERLLPIPPAAPVAVEAEQVSKERRTVQDDIDEQLLPLLLEEADDLYPRIGASLRDWRAQPGQQRLGNSLQRLLHTLKGSARMAGVMRFGELTHRMEDRVVAAMAQPQPDDVLWEELENYCDRIGGALEQLRGLAVAPPEAASAQPRPATAGMLRVHPEAFDLLVNDAGEIGMARVHAETGLRACRDSLLELTDSVGRLRSQLREIEIQAESRMVAGAVPAQHESEEFDSPELDRVMRLQELTRLMNESVHDVQTVQHGLLRQLDEIAAALSAQTLLNRDLQHGLLAIRMVQFSSIGERLYRIVRQTAKELGKRADLELVGAGQELDRSVLERMAAPLEHMLRNAVAHGLEDPAQREQLGKPSTGTIRLAVVTQNNEVVFELSDDGRGLDLNLLRQRAHEHGMVKANEKVSDEQAMQLVFASGISTAGEVTAIAGRGIGMDVVRSEVAALGGRVEVHSEPGKGTTFRLHLPLTLAQTQVLMIRAGKEVYAVPAAMVEQVVDLDANELVAAIEAGTAEWQGRSYPLQYLPQLLGHDGSPPPPNANTPALLLRNGEQRMALQVDELLGNREAVIKNVGPQLARLAGIAGATVLANGRVVLILNPLALEPHGVVLPLSEQQPVEAEPARPLVMVVDDSLTMRKITSRMLSRAGYEVATAKDGLDALEQLHRLRPAVILLDIEMPRMDGFELTERLRSDPELKELPIIMVTSRHADKHRNHALELGVNAYFGKPYQEVELLQQIADCLNPPPG